MNRTLTFCFLVLAFCSFSQETETILIGKNKGELFQGSSQEVSNWYLYMDANKTWYLANINITSSEAKAWFEKHKDSQNIFKGMMGLGSYPTISFRKENDPETTLNFYVKFENENTKIRGIILTSIDDGNNYVFLHK